MAEADLDFRELSTFSRRALANITRRYPRMAKTAMRKVGQRAVKLQKMKMIEKGMSRRSPLYKSVKKTGVWGDERHGYNIRTYMSSSGMPDGRSPYEYAWWVEHGHRIVTNTGVDTGRTTTPQRYTSAAIPKMQKEFENLLEDYIDELLQQGVDVGV